jgi:hypothetical protein
MTNDPLTSSSLLSFAKSMSIAFRTFGNSPAVRLILLSTWRTRRTTASASSLRVFRRPGRRTSMYCFMGTGTFSSRAFIQRREAILVGT